MRVGAVGAEPGDRAVDEARVERAHDLRRKAELLDHARPMVLDIHVGILQQCTQHLALGLLLKVDLDAALVAVERLELRAVEPCSKLRKGSPIPGRSTLMTSAPRSASSMAAYTAR